MDVIKDWFLQKKYTFAKAYKLNTTKTQKINGRKCK